MIVEWSGNWRCKDEISHANVAGDGMVCLLTMQNSNGFVWPTHGPFGPRRQKLEKAP